MYKENPVSFEDLRTINNITYETNEQACRKLGLITDNKFWLEIME